MRLSIRLGAIDQSIDPLLNKLGLPGTFRQLGHTTVAFERFRGCIVTRVNRDAAIEDTPEMQRLLQKESDEVWGQGFSPLFTIRGMLVYDPRDINQSPTDENTWRWSRNAALVIANMLQHRLFGSGVSYEDIDLEALKIAADICDVKFETYDGRKIPQYTLDGYIYTSESQATIINDMLTNCNGRIYQVGGKYVIDIATPREPIATITDEQLIGNNSYLPNLDINERYDIVQGQFQDINSLGEQTDAPVLQVGNNRKNNNILNLNLRFVRDPYRAQRIMLIRLRKSQLGKSMVLDINASGLQYVPGDIIVRESKMFPETNGTYEIQQITTNEQNGSLRIDFFEFSNDVFNITPGDFNPYERTAIIDERIGIADTAVNRILDVVGV